LASEHQCGGAELLVILSEAGGGAGAGLLM
jgi:hypothetical protein